MGECAKVIDIESLRRSCSQCSLHVLCLPANIGAEDMGRLDAIVQTRRPLKRGDTLYRVGQTLGSLFVAREGAFKTFASTAQGDDQVIGFHLPGELIGLDALANGRHSCQAEALTHAEVCEIPLNQLEAVCRQVPGLQRQLMRIIGQGMQRDQTHMEMLGRRHANERLALFLHGLSERYRLLGRSAEMFMLPMSRVEIASYLGLVIETVSRTLSKLQDDGLISVRGRQVKVLNPSALEALAHASEVDGTKAALG